MLIPPQLPNEHNYTLAITETSNLSELLADVSYIALESMGGLSVDFSYVAEDSFVSTSALLEYLAVVRWLSRRFTNKKPQRQLTVCKPRCGSALADQWAQMQIDGVLSQWNIFVHRQLPGKKLYRYEPASQFFADFSHSSARFAKQVGKAVSAMFSDEYQNMIHKYTELTVSTILLMTNGDSITAAYEPSEGVLNISAFNGQEIALPTQEKSTNIILDVLEREAFCRYYPYLMAGYGFMRLAYATAVTTVYSDGGGTLTQEPIYFTGSAPIGFRATIWLNLKILSQKHLNLGFE